jgi:hypothetical protein
MPRLGAVTVDRWRIDVGVAVGVAGSEPVTTLDAHLPRSPVPLAAGRLGRRCPGSAVKGDGGRLIRESVMVAA